MSVSEIITSASNPLIARVRALGRRDRRQEAGEFVVEGRRAVEDALDAGATPSLLLAREDQAEAPLAGVPAGVSTRVLAQRLFDGLSDVVAPSGVLAVFPFPRLDEPADGAPLILVLDKLRDPGNAGTLLRTAAAAGATAVYVGPESVDPFNPKCVRAAMGAHFRIPLRWFTPETLGLLQATIPLRVAAAGDARTSYDAINWNQPALVIIGSEADGISPEMMAFANQQIAIPIAAGVESLNAAVAGAVILFEAARQRRVKRTT